MKFGLEVQVIENIISVLEQHPKVDKAFVFGSRAKGNYRPDSDIDIAIKGNGITTDDIIAISVAIETNGITNKFDLIDYNSIKEPALKEHIDRVGIEFYSSWKEIKLGKFINVINGYAFKSTDFLDTEKPNTLPIIKIKNVANGDVNLDGVHHHLYTENLKKYIVENNDILISLTGNHPELETQVVGLVSKFKLNIKAFLNQRVAKLASNNIEELNNDYLYYFLKNKDTHQYLASQSSGSANQANISKTDIENIPVLLPPIQEQTAIASILSSLDDKIDLLHRQNKTLEELAETLFKQWFVEEVEESWEEKSLPEIAEYLNGLALQKHPANIDYLPVIKIREMKQGISENTDKCSKDIPKQYIIQDGDVLFSWSGSLEVVLWTGGEGALNQHLFKVSSIKYPKWFYYLATKHHLGDFKVIAESKSTTMGHIQREHLKQAMISIPPKQLFNQYNDSIAPMIDKLIYNNKQIRTLTQTRDTLLPKLISGEVRVKM
jgi:type I restriction enzyme S subunit